MAAIDLTNHFYRKSCEDIAKTCQPLTDLARVNSFRYLRLFNDGSRIVLGNNAEVFDYLYREENYLRAWYDTGTPPISESGWHTWATASAFDTPAQRAMAAELKERFNVSHDVHYLKIHPDSYEIFAFASDSPNVYLQNKRIFNQFIFYFKEQKKNLLDKALNEKIILPLPNGKIIYKKTKNDDVESLLPVKKFILDEKSKLSLTKTEKEMVLFYSQGQTAKSIANQLSISPRTVEHRVETIKQKLNCNKSSQLYARLIELGLIES